MGDEGLFALLVAINTQELVKLTLARLARGEPIEAPSKENGGNVIPGEDAEHAAATSLAFLQAYLLAQGLSNDEAKTRARDVIRRWGEAMERIMKSQHMA